MHKKKMFHHYGSVQGDVHKSRCTLRRILLIWCLVLKVNQLSSLIQR